MPRTALSRDTPCEERLVSARTSFFFRESLADLIIYPTRLKRRLRENPFLVSSLLQFFSYNTQYVSVLIVHEFPRHCCTDVLLLLVFVSFIFFLTDPFI